MFVYSQDDKSFYTCLTESSCTFTEIFMITIQGSAWIEKQLIPSGCFVLNSESDFSHISTTRSQAGGNINLGGGNKGFLTVPTFSWKS